MATRTAKTTDAPTRKVFLAKAQQQDSPEPIEFELWGDVYTAKPRLQAVEIINFLKKNNDDATLSESFDDVILPFFEAALTKESYAKFTELIHSDDRIMEVSDFVEVLQWLIEQYTDRPTPGSQK